VGVSRAERPVDDTASDEPKGRRIGSAGRLASLHAAVLAVVLGVVVVALVRSFSASYESAAASSLGLQLSQFERGAATRPASEGLKPFAIRFLQTHPLASGNAVIVALRGRGLVVTGNTTAIVHDPRIHKWFALPPVSTTAFTATIGGVPLEVVASPIRIGAASVGTYVATSDLTPFVAQRQRVLHLSLAEATIALLVGVASAFWLLRRLLRRVGRITSTAEQIGSGDLGQRLGTQGDSDEVGELAHTFDSMLDRLDNSMRAQRRLLADVSHQLRTPVTVVRGHLEVLNRTGEEDLAEVRETLDIAIDELDQMAGLIERLLTLGHAMEADRLDPLDVDLREFLPPILDAVRVLAPRGFELGAVPEVTIHVDATQLRGALSNLLDNAVRATPPEGIVVLGAQLRGSGEVAIDVEDGGTGIPAAQRGAVLERFSRPGARDEDGSGLGLAIAKAVALAHGGEIEIDQSPRLGGARVSIVLPASVVRTEVR